MTRQIISGGHGLTRGGFLRKMLGEIAVVASTDVIIDHFKDAKHKPATLESVTQFWREAGRSLLLGRRVTICGVLSLYAPVFVDAPRRKRAVHREFRRLRRSEEGVELDMLLAVSAGQMVVRYPVAPDAPNVFLGLYHSIVRNSIPVIINREYYEETVCELFEDGRRTAAEVELTGHIIDISGNSVSNRLRQLAAHRFGATVSKALKQADTLPSDNGKTYALQIDGHGDTGVTPGNPVNARYLDGDIWLAVQDKNGQEHLISRFVDVADLDDLRDEDCALRADAEKHIEGGQIIRSYDMTKDQKSGT